MLKTSGPSGLTGKFYQVFKEEILAILQKTEAKGILPSSVCETSTPLAWQRQWRKLCAIIPDGHKFKFSKQKFSKSNSYKSIYLKNNIPWSSGIYLRNAWLFSHLKSISIIHHIKKLKNKNHMVISTNAEKCLTKYNVHSL